MTSYHWVSGYYRKDGTYVKGHYQTNPNDTKNDNWSTTGNVNPFTGEAGTLSGGTNGGTATVTTTTSTGGTSTTTTTGTGTSTTGTNLTINLTSFTNPALDYSQRITGNPGGLTSLAAWPNRYYMSFSASQSTTYENEGKSSFSYDLYHSFVVANLRNDSSYHISLSGSKSSANIWVHDGGDYQLNPSGSGTTNVNFSPAVSGQYIFWVYDDFNSHPVTLSMTEDVGKDGRNSLTTPTIPVAPVAVVHPYINHTVSKANSLVDETFYLAANPDVAAAKADPASHFLQYGWTEGRDPNPWFDTGFYLESNPDVKAAGVDPLLHYQNYGWKEGRDPSLAFSTSEYLKNNADVLKAGVNPLSHFLNYGYNENRSSYASALAPSF